MSSRTLSLAYSPCPNDTYLFSAIAAGELGLPGVNLDIHLEDIETLNRAALQQQYDVMKVSFSTYLQIRDHYQLLDTGAALGFGCGPLLLSARQRHLHGLRDCSVVFPGETTTAYLLFRLLGIETGAHHFAPYDEIMPRLQAGEFDCGVIIHESRFTYQDVGLHCLVDLGSWWETQTSLPIPLGCFVMRKHISTEFKKAFEALMRTSIRRAQSRNLLEDAYIREHAQEMDTEVLQQHIDLYVNEYTLSLGEAGRQAVAVLERRAQQVGIAA